MAKIFDVDFKNKKLILSFEEGRRTDSEIRQLMVNFADSLRIIDSISPQKDYVNHCAAVFRNIILSLREK